LKRLHDFTRIDGLEQTRARIAAIAGNRETDHDVAVALADVERQSLTAAIRDNDFFRGGIPSPRHPNRIRARVQRLALTSQQVCSFPVSWIA
jgi:hypothetical protein